MGSIIVVLTQQFSVRKNILRTFLRALLSVNKTSSKRTSYVTIKIIEVKQSFGAEIAIKNLWWSISPKPLKDRTFQYIFMPD